MIRTATPDDAGAVTALERDCLGSDAWSGALVADAIAGRAAGVQVLVAVAEASAVVGHAVLCVNGDIADLQRIAVAAGHRRRGHASRLLDEVVAVSRRGGADRLLVEVRADNRDALAFYAERDFLEIDRRPRYYADRTDAVVMRLPLVKGCG